MKRNRTVRLKKVKEDEIDRSGAVEEESSSQGKDDLKSHQVMSWHLVCNFNEKGEQINGDELREL